MIVKVKWCGSDDRDCSGYGEESDKKEGDKIMMVVEKITIIVKKR